MKLTFIGDIMLGRNIGQKYRKLGGSPVDNALVSEIKKSDFIIANLESAVCPDDMTESDHLSFLAPKEIIKEFDWIDAFSTSNNHINDGGNAGIEASIQTLNKCGRMHNGVFKDKYVPLIVSEGNNKIAVITLTDMLNVELQDSKWKLLRMGDENISEIIKEYKDKGFFVIMFAHVGSLFTRFPNPITFDYLHRCIDDGCDAIVTAHSHCIGGVEQYKGKPIYHSLGDFVMDGNSFRRRLSSYITFDIDNNKLAGYTISYAQINNELVTIIPSLKTQRKLEKSAKEVSNKIEKYSKKYSSFYKWQYKKEIMDHTVSTLGFILKDRGLIGMLKLLIIRSNEAKRMVKWISSDRSKLQRDDDALSERIDNNRLKK